MWRKFRHASYLVTSGHLTHCEAERDQRTAKHSVIVFMLVNDGLLILLQKINDSIINAMIKQ